MERAIPVTALQTDASPRHPRPNNVAQACLRTRKPPVTKNPRTQAVFWYKNTPTPHWTLPQSPLDTRRPIVVSSPITNFQNNQRSSPWPYQNGKSQRCACVCAKPTRRRKSPQSAPAPNAEHRVNRTAPARIAACTGVAKSSQSTRPSRVGQRPR